MFDFVEQATFEPCHLFLATCTLSRERSHRSQVLLGTGPGIFARVAGFRGDAAKQDQDFDLDRIVCRLGSTFFQLALTEPQLVRQDADTLHVSAQRERDDCMACFVISGR